MINVFEVKNNEVICFYKIFEGDIKLIKER